MPVTRSYNKKDDILIFDSQLDDRSTYDERHLDVLREAEQHHFWFSTRRKKICQTFQKYVDKDASILEIGGGTGFVAEELIKRGFSVEMGDIHLHGLNIAKNRGVKKLYQFDLFHPPFCNEFDVICLFDVLEHLEEEQQAFACIKTMLKPGGKIILTVPAHKWLWSRDDVVAGHKRRYTKEYLEQIFLQSGLSPLHIQYFFISILPLLYIRKWLRKDVGDPLSPQENVAMSMHPLLNHILHGLTSVELCFERYLPNRMGGSLLAVAKVS